MRLSRFIVAAASAWCVVGGAGGQFDFGERIAYRCDERPLSRPMLTDVTGDGRPDLVLNIAASNLRFIENQRGRFALGPTARVQEVIDQRVLPHATETLADLDGDGDVDVALSHYAGDVFRLAAAINDGGSFSVGPVTTLEKPRGDYVFLRPMPTLGGHPADGLRLEDIDLNGADLVVLRLLEDGTFEQRRFDRPERSFDPLHARDVSGDDLPDLLWRERATGDLLAQNGVDGVSFDAPAPAPASVERDDARRQAERLTPDGAPALKAQRVDLDLDGRQDLLFAWWARPNVGVSVAYGTGDGGYGEPVSLAINRSVPTRAVFDLADVDADGDLDLAIGDESAGAFGTPEMGEFSGVIYNGAIDGGRYAGDVDADGMIGAADLAAVVARWGQRVPIHLAEDPTGDGRVSSEDIAMLLARWGAGPQAVGAR